MHRTSGGRPTSPPDRTTVEVGADRLTTATWGDGPPSVVMLHDGLGSIAQWRDLPARLAARTGLTVLAYDRAGHGSSTPVPTGPWPPDWLHREARVLAGLLDAVGAEDPAFVGHSDGGSIAAIHAAGRPTSGPIVLLAAHAWVEAKTSGEIQRMRDAPDRVVAALGRFHAEPAAVFDAWSAVWTSDEFAHWDIRGLVGTVEAPALVVQGDGDEFAAAEHAATFARSIGDNAACRLLPGLGHNLHHEDPALVADIAGSFITSRPRPNHSTFS